MTEKIFAIADGLCGAGEEERELLRILASDAESRVRKASEGTDTAEDILACAAAWLAAADLLTALSALQIENQALRNSANGFKAENEKLRAELEQIPSCIYYKQGGLCRYGGDDPANVCVLGPCDHDVSVQDVLTELKQVKTERDAIEQDFRDFTKQWWEEDSGFPCRWCKFENADSCEWKVKCQSEEKICAGRAFEWRGKKEG